MHILAYDTETTGIARGHDYTNPDNPHLAAITGILYDTEAKRVVSSLNLFVHPDDWAMPEEAGAVNGLTTEFLLKFGLPLDQVLPPFVSLADRADLLIAHNIDFDTKIISAALWRYLTWYNPHPEDAAHETIQTWQNRKGYCTMKESKDIVQAQAKNGRLKNPRLEEAYQYFFNRPLDKAHSANADTVAVLEIYTALNEVKL